MIGLSNAKRKNILFYAIVIFLIAYFAYLFIQTTIDYNALVKEEKLYLEKIAYEQEKKVSLTELEKKADSNETIENLARNNLNYLKENEILFIDGEKID